MIYLWGYISDVLAIYNIRQVFKIKCFPNLMDQLHNYLQNYLHVLLFACYFSLKKMRNTCGSNALNSKHVFGELLCYGGQTMQYAVSWAKPELLL